MMSVNDSYSAVTNDIIGRMTLDITQARGLPNEAFTSPEFLRLEIEQLFPSNVQFLMFEPVTVDETIMHMWFYFAEEAAEADEHREGRDALVAHRDVLTAEDIGICRRLQQGRSCDACDGEQFSPYWDAGTLHFHRQIAEAVRGIGDFAR